MQAIKPWRFYLLFLLLALAALYVHTRSEASVPVNQPLEFFPQVAGDWRMVGNARFDKRTLEVLLPTDYLSRQYVDKEGNRVSLYIGYHDGGPQSGPIHSPRQCLPGSGWTAVRAQVREFNADGETLSYVSALYQKDLQKQLFLYWFQVREKMLTNEYLLKLAMVKNSILDNRRDSSFIRLSLMTGDEEEETVRVGERFIRDFMPAIRATLPR